MKKLRLYSMSEIRYVLSSMSRWDNNVGHQARHLLYWHRRGWIQKRDLRDTVHSLLEQAEAYGLLSRKDVVRLIAHEQLKNLIAAMQVYPGEFRKEEAVAMYMLAAKEALVDVEKSISLYLTYKEEYGKELKEWQQKMKINLAVQPKKKLSGPERRRLVLETRRKMKEKRLRLKTQEWVEKKELDQPWAEERKEFLQLSGQKKDEPDVTND